RVPAVAQPAPNPPPLVPLRGEQAPRQALDVPCALVRGFVSPLSRERIREDVGEETKPRQQLVRPVPIFRHGADGQAALDDAALDHRRYRRGYCALPRQTTTIGRTLVG